MGMPAINIHEIQEYISTRKSHLSKMMEEMEEADQAWDYEVYSGKLREIQLFEVWLNEGSEG